jgi:hypothetical protein
MTLNQLKQSVTDEEVLLWQAFYSIKAKREKAEADKIRKRRR